MFFQVYSMDRLLKTIRTDSVNNAMSEASKCLLSHKIRNGYVTRLVRPEYIKRGPYYEITSSAQNIDAIWDVFLERYSGEYMYTTHVIKHSRGKVSKYYIHTRTGIYGKF